ncbi:MAG: OmpA family protein, partial [bacterium]
TVSIWSFLLIASISLLFADSNLSSSASISPNAVMDRSRNKQPFRLGMGLGSNIGGSGAVPFGYQANISLSHPIYRFLEGEASLASGVISSNTVDRIALNRGEYKLLLHFKRRAETEHWTPYFYLGLGQMQYDISGMSGAASQSGAMGFIPFGIGTVGQTTHFFSTNISFGYNGLLRRTAEFKKYGPQGFITFNVGISIVHSGYRYFAKSRPASGSTPAVPEVVAVPEDKEPAGFSALSPTYDLTENTVETSEEIRITEEPQVENPMPDFSVVADEGKTEPGESPPASSLPEAIDTNIELAGTGSTTEMDLAPNSVQQIAPAAPLESHVGYEKISYPARLKDILQKPLVFEYKEAELDRNSIPILRTLALLLIQNPRMKLEIQGHTDNIGSRQYNVCLSYRRAKAVKELLVSEGVSADQLLPIGYGFEKPIASNETVEGRYRNRRIEFREISSPDEFADKHPVSHGFILEEGQLRVIKELCFDYNSCDIAGVSEAVLEQMTSMLKQNPEIKIEVLGHTDDIGSWAYNQELSRRRAESIREYLVRKGIAADRVVARGLSYDNPIADNRNSEGRKRNRRIEIVRVA